MTDINEIVRNLLEAFLKDKGLEMYDIEYLKEGKDYVLRVYIDKLDDYISTDECEMVSNYLSDKLDELDPIEDNYILEVSSPGMDRELKTDAHFERYIGEMVDIKLSKPLNEEYNFEGKLTGFTSNEVEITCIIDTKKDKRKPGAKVGKNSLSEVKYSFKRDDIKSVRLAIIF